MLTSSEVRKKHPSNIFKICRHFLHISSTLSWCFYYAAINNKSNRTNADYVLCIAEGKSNLPMSVSLYSKAKQNDQLFPTIFNDIDKCYSIDYWLVLFNVLGNWSWLIYCSYFMTFPMHYCLKSNDCTWTSIPVLHIIFFPLQQEAYVYFGYLANALYTLFWPLLQFPW